MCGKRKMMVCFAPVTVACELTPACAQIYVRGSCAVINPWDDLWLLLCVDVPVRQSVMACGTVVR